MMPSPSGFSACGITSPQPEVDKANILLRTFCSLDALLYYYTRAALPHAYNNVYITLVG